MGVRRFLANKEDRDSLHAAIRARDTRIAQQDELLGAKDQLIRDLRDELEAERDLRRRAENALSGGVR